MRALAIPPAVLRLDGRATTRGQVRTDLPLGMELLGRDGLPVNLPSPGHARKRWPLVVTSCTPGDRPLIDDTQILTLRAAIRKRPTGWLTIGSGPRSVVTAGPPLISTGGQEQDRLIA